MSNPNRPLGVEELTTMGAIMAVLMILRELKLSYKLSKIVVEFLYHLYKDFDPVEIIKDPNGKEKMKTQMMDWMETKFPEVPDAGTGRH